MLIDDIVEEEKKGDDLIVPAQEADGDHVKNEDSSQLMLLDDPK